MEQPLNLIMTKAPSKMALGMPAITISDAKKKYIERLRKKIPLDTVPTVKDTVGFVLEFLETKEAEFTRWMKNKKGREE
jgi:hypothetical protein